MPPVGSPAVRLTTAPNGMFDGAPAFSPDGKQIAFVRNTDDGGNPAIYLVPAEGGEEKKLTAIRGIRRLTWTADGRRIVFGAIGFFVGENALYSVAATGGVAERLSFISADAFQPTISRQGDKLAYASGFLDSNIWRISIIGASAPSKVISSTRMDMQPNFSPDGTKLAFASNRDGPTAVWVSNSDGTDPVRVSKGLGATPEWSPDGKRIVFDNNEGGRWDIWVMNADGGQEIRLTGDSSDHRAPSWSSDGEWVYFSSNRSGVWEIWKVSLASKQSLQVTQHGGGYAQESRDGRFVYYQKLSTADQYEVGLLPEIWRVPSSGGSEEVVVNTNENPANVSLAWFWRVTSEGIFFVDNSAKPLTLLKFYNFATRNLRTLRRLGKQAWGGPGLAVSPDGESILVGQIDAEGSDIMLVENFH